MEIIRCDNTDYLINKWHSEINKNKDNGIVLGSSLRVKQGQVAIFVCKQKDGNYQDFIQGPFDKFLETKNIPIISNILNLAYNNKAPFQAEVYFVNTLKLIQMRFGVPYFDVFDNVKSDFSVPISVRGSINMRIKDVNEFVSIFGLRDLSIEEYKEFIMSAIKRYVKSTICNLPSLANINCIKLEQKIDYVSEVLKQVLKERLDSEFGVELTSLDIDAIEVDKESKDYKDLIKVSKKISLKNIIHNARISRLKDDVEIANDMSETLEKATEIALKIIDKIKSPIEIKPNKKK